MAVSERSDSGDYRRGVVGGQIVLRYDIDSVSTRADAYSALVAAAPTSESGWPATEYAARPNGTEHLWIGEVIYEPPTYVLFPGQVRLRGSTVGGRQRINYSLSTTSYGTSPPDHNNAIEEHEPGRPEGTDIVTPSTQLTWESAITWGDLNLAYLNTLNGLTGKTNDATFGPFDAGEGLFLGADFSQREDGYFDVAWHFAASADRSSVVVGGITVTTIPGHDYVWGQWAPDETASNKAGKLIGIYVERVYERGDMTALGFTPTPTT